MKFGVTLRNMGPEATSAAVKECSQTAETYGFESIWITDHLAIPPDDAEGSEGYYLDPLTTLAYLAGVTEKIGLGTGVLILPYRPKLPTAKQIATLQTLAQNRLILGVGAGWMSAEFRALGVDRRQRGAITDETLAFIDACFNSDEVTLNGQSFLFKPRPIRPEILVGGSAPHALKRAAAFADGWLPMVTDPEKLAKDLQDYRELTQRLGQPEGKISVMTRLPLEKAKQVRDLLSQYHSLGVDRLIHAQRYQTVKEYEAGLIALKQHIEHFESRSTNT
jgi:probable F420-dependent oxidoreductase